MRVQFTSLVDNQEGGGACFLLQLGEALLLLDCGWDDAFDPRQLGELAALAPMIDAVLVTHADVAHLGALAYAVEQLGLVAPVYATLPVVKMGLLHMYDALATALQRWTGFDCFTLDSIDRSIGGAHEIKYAQIVKLSGRARGITIAPHPAGHSIGGCVWRISIGAEEILYCPEYNHLRERHLPPGRLDRFSKPSLLIAGTRHALASAERSAPRTFIKLVSSALLRGGDVLVPSDAAGRCLELLSLLEAQWRGQPLLHAYPIVFLAHQAFNTIEFAKSQLEWLSDAGAQTPLTTHPTARSLSSHALDHTICHSCEGV
jgi:cleavage and polyadenylation specificity factor subunit 2